MARVWCEAVLRRNGQAFEKSWYDVYQWPSLSRSTYTEIISSIILDEYDTIELRTEGVRKRTFKYHDHHGLRYPATWEKRFCLALYNARKVHLLGDVLDYEVPLKEKQSSDHGDIDVLCWNGDGLLITEVKAYNSKHSLLKAILQAFTYTSLVTTAKARFTRSFKAPDETKLIPAVSVFENADTERHLAHDSLRHQKL